MPIMVVKKNRAVSRSFYVRISKRRSSSRLYYDVVAHDSERTLVVNTAITTSNAGTAGIAAAGRNCATINNYTTARTIVTAANSCRHARSSGSNGTSINSYCTTTTGIIVSTSNTCGISRTCSSYAATVNVYGSAMSTRAVVIAANTSTTISASNCQ